MSHVPPYKHRNLADPITGWCPCGAKTAGGCHYRVEEVSVKSMKNGPVSVRRGLLATERTDGAIVEICADHPTYGRVAITIVPECRGGVCVGVGIGRAAARRMLGPVTLSAEQGEALAGAIGAMLDGE